MEKISMKCFARWEKDDNSKVFFRDQTILQFGDSWELRANFILLNPGSALPINELDQSDFLRSKYLPFFVEPGIKEKYFEFSIDRLMNDVLKLFSSEYIGGTIRLYNLFNLKKQISDKAIDQFQSNKAHPKMFSKDSEIVFGNAPVIIASGGNSKEMELKKELIRYISLAKIGNLFKLAKSGDKEFSIVKAQTDKNGFIESYHPSYTFKYGNTTKIGELRTIIFKWMAKSATT